MTRPPTSVRHLFYLFYGQESLERQVTLSFRYGSLTYSIKVYPSYTVSGKSFGVKGKGDPSLC